MDYTGRLPTEIIEEICDILAKDIPAKDTSLEFLFADVGPSHRINEPLKLVNPSARLSSLPLIHSRWHVPGQKALYCYISLRTADQYKRLQDCLSLHPKNGVYIREIAIHWGLHDFGGPDGYSYKVLGWFHEMEIQEVMRLCPHLLSFQASPEAPVISREGIAALGTIETIRRIVWRMVDIQQYWDTIAQNHANWEQLQIVQVCDTQRLVECVNRSKSEKRGSSFLSDCLELLTKYHELLTKFRASGSRA